MEVAPPPDSGDMDMYAGPNALSIVLLGVIYFAFLTLPDIIGSEH